MAISAEWKLGSVGGGSDICNRKALDGHLVRYYFLLHSKLKQNSPLVTKKVLSDHENTYIPSEKELR